MSRRRRNKNKYKKEEEPFDWFQGTEFAGKIGLSKKTNECIVPFISKNSSNRKKSKGWNNNNIITLSPKTKKTNYELLLENKTILYISSSTDWQAFEEVAKFINQQGNLGEYTLMCRKHNQERIVVIIEGPGDESSRN